MPENREQRTKNSELGTENREQRTENRKQRTKNKEQRTKNKEQRTKNKEQRTKNKEQRTKKRSGCIGRVLKGRGFSCAARQQNEERGFSPRGNNDFAKRLSHTLIN
jgi:hypothetical protein